VLKCTGDKWRTNSKYWKMQDRKLQDPKMQGHFTGLENAVTE